MECYLESVSDKPADRVITRVRYPWSPTDLAKATGRGQPGVWEVLHLKRKASKRLLADLAYALGLELEEFEKRLYAGQYKGIGMSKSDRSQWRRDPDGVTRCRVCGKPSPDRVNEILTHERNHARMAPWLGVHERRRTI